MEKVGWDQSRRQTTIQLFPFSPRGLSSLKSFLSKSADGSLIKQRAKAKTTKKIELFYLLYCSVIISGHIDAQIHIFEIINVIKLIMLSVSHIRLCEHTERKSKGAH